MNDRRKLTLAQWSDKYEVPVANQNGMTFVVLPDQLRRKTDENMSWDLAHLIDYAVSSVSGPVAWLTGIGTPISELTEDAVDFLYEEYRR